MRRQLEGKTARVADRVAREVVRELQRDAPIETGEFQSLISAQVKNYANGTAIDVTSAAPYAQYVREHRVEWDRVMRRLPDMIQRAWRAT